MGRGKGEGERRGRWNERSLEEVHTNNHELRKDEEKTLELAKCLLREDPFTEYAAG